MMVMMMGWDGMEGQEGSSSVDYIYIIYNGFWEGMGGGERLV